MKIAAAYIASFVCYWLGHALSLVMNSEVTARLYPVYNRLMCWSSDVEEWAGIEFKWAMVDADDADFPLQWDERDAQV